MVGMFLPLFLFANGSRSMIVKELAEIGRRDFWMHGSRNPEQMAGIKRCG